MIDVLRQFLIDAAAQMGEESSLRISVVCLAVAGVVTDNVCRLTNIDWTIDGDEIEQTLRVGEVEIINDFVAQGYGILTLNKDDLICLHNAPSNENAPIACLGAGTGLGVCFLTPSGNGKYTCHPSEGGHAEWAPRGHGSDKTQIELLGWLKIKYSGWNRVSAERVASGPGIANIYGYLAWRDPHRIDKEAHRQFMQTGRSAVAITSNAYPGTLCEQAVDIFCDCYGSEAGVVALTFMPFGGLYITGGVTSKLVTRITQSPEFMEAYRDKGRVSPLLDRVPLFVVPDDLSMGERGSHLRAVQLLKSFDSRLKQQRPKNNKHSLVPPEHTILG